METNFHIYESLLYYLWKYQKFDTSLLKTTHGEPITVLATGFQNEDAGPDFKEARITIDGIEWAGHVEIHTKTSDWLRHGHQHDDAYQNVILHVVWEEDQAISLNNESTLPTLELKGRISEGLLDQVAMLMNNSGDITCKSMFHTASSITVSTQLDRVMIERLSDKAGKIFELLDTTKNDWAETFYRLMASTFGFSLNKEPFGRLAQLLPFRVLNKHKGNLAETEALLYGVGGFLEEDREDSYQTLLKSHFMFFAKKYDLEPLSRSVWHFSKTRPANFPTVRLAQLAKMIHLDLLHVQEVIQASSAKAIIQAFQVSLEGYWSTHYDFGKVKSRPTKNISAATYENILINAVAPLLAAYGQFTGSTEYTEKAVELLQGLPAENNRITRKWDGLLNIATAFDSQASIQQLKVYCQQKKCLNCNIGVALLK